MIAMHRHQAHAARRELGMQTEVLFALRRRFRTMQSKVDAMGELAALNEAKAKGDCVLEQDCRWCDGIKGEVHADECEVIK